MKLGIAYVQFAILWELSLMAVGTQIVGALDFDLTHRRQQGFSTQFHILGLLATATGDVALLGAGGHELQQLGQGSGSGLVHGGTNRRFHGF